MAKSPTGQLLDLLGLGPEVALFGALNAAGLAAARAGGDAPAAPAPARRRNPPAVKAEPAPAPAADGKRRRGRARFRGAVEIRSRLSGSTRQDHARDLSDDGIFVETADPLDVGDPVVITLRTDIGPVQLNGRVRWVTAFGRYDDPTPGMGIEFVGLDPNKRERLSSLLRPAKPEDAE